MSLLLLFGVVFIENSYNLLNHCKLNWYIGSILLKSNVAKNKIELLSAAGLYFSLSLSILIVVSLDSSIFWLISSDLVLLSFNWSIRSSFSKNLLILPPSKAFNILSSVAVNSANDSKFSIKIAFFLCSNSGISLLINNVIICSCKPCGVIPKLTIVTLTNVSGL